jgi:hypothetical protein
MLGGFLFICISVTTSNKVIYDIKLDNRRIMIIEFGIIGVEEIVTVFLLDGEAYKV